MSNRISYEDNDAKDLMLDEVRILASRGLSQKEIGARINYSQQHVSRLISKLKEQARVNLREHAFRLPWELELIIENLRDTRRMISADLEKTTDVRSRAQLYSAMLAVNKDLFAFLNSSDIIERIVLDAEVLRTAAKKDIKTAERELAVLHGGNGTAAVESSSPKVEGGEVASGASAVDSDYGSNVSV